MKRSEIPSVNKMTVAVLVGILLIPFLDSLINKAFAQPFIGMQLTNKGIGVQTGFLVGNIEITLAYKPISNQENKPKIASLSACYRILVTRNELNNFSVTPSIGIGNYRVKDFTGYDADPTGKTGILQINTNTPVYGLNLAKDMYKGQIFVSADYCKGFYYGVGIRCYFYRKIISQY